MIIPAISGAAWTKMRRNALRPPVRESVTNGRITEAIVAIAQMRALMETSRLIGSVFMACFQSPEGEEAPPTHDGSHVGQMSNQFSLPLLVINSTMLASVEARTSEPLSSSDLAEFLTITAVRRTVTQLRKRVTSPASVGPTLTRVHPVPSASFRMHPSRCCSRSLFRHGSRRRSRSGF